MIKIRIFFLYIYRFFSHLFEKILGFVKKHCILVIVISILLIIVIIPYLTVDLLTVSHKKEFMTVNLTPIENVYAEGVPVPDDIKVYRYNQKSSAKVLIVLDNKQVGLMAEVLWNGTEWIIDKDNYTIVWTYPGGTAGELFWPLYYWDKVIRWV